MFLKIIKKAGPGKKQIENLIGPGKNIQSKVGWFESAKYEDGTPVAYVAAIQEKGSPERSIPPRPFFRKTINDQQVKWKQTIKSEVKKVLKNQKTLFDVMELLGLMAAGNVQKTISKITTPPLSPVTILLRKYRKLGIKVTGKTVGEAHKVVNFIGPRPKKDKSANISGVSTKPLVDTGYMLATLASITENKK